MESLQVFNEARAADVVVATVRALVEELTPRLADRVSLDSVLDRELGLDSLALVELISRLEAALGTPLPDDSLVRARTPRDLLAAVKEAPAASIARREPGTERESGTERARPAPAPALAGAAWVPETARTLLDVLDWHAERHPDRVHIRLLQASGPPEEITYGHLASAARAAARGLRGEGIGPGDSVALMLPTCPDYFVAFFGALLAGGVPVPIYPPSRPSDIEEHLQRQGAILDNAQARVLVSVPEAATAARLLRLRVPSLRRMVTPGDLVGADPAPQADQNTATGHTPAPAGLPTVSDTSTALLQYTSGATNIPKGVVLTHAHLLASIRSMGMAAEVVPEDVFVSWLPLYHDMGLIGAWLGALYFGVPLILMPPTTFLARPVRWLQAVHEYRGTLSAAPNFAYELCLQRIKDDELAGLDLSSWRIAMNGAEPVSPRTMRQFAERLAPTGLRGDAIFPVYGLAEASLGVTFPTPGHPPTIDRIVREQFAASGDAVPAGPEDDALDVVGCGHPLPGFEVRIVDAAGHAEAERRQGRIEFRGPSTTGGYLRNPDATAELFHDGWLRSGDLGYLAAGELFVTGRAKDLVIRAGRNIHPQEIEEAVGDIPGVRKGRVAAFGVPDVAAGTERLIVLVETREQEEGARQRIREAIVAASVDAVGAPPDDVVLASPGTIPKTSSGKLRRADCRRRYEEGHIEQVSRPPWRQVAGLVSSAARHRARRLPAATLTALYGSYAWAVVGLVAPPVWLLEAVVPEARRWGVFRSGARAFLLLCGARPRIEGLDRMPPGACVVVANHASVLDGLVLAAALPGPLVFPVVGDLASTPVAGPFLRRIGAAFVDREDRKEAAGVATRLLEAARAGAILAFFPEGTMARIPGLHPFRMGAFVVAAEAGVPVLPVAIRGTGDILRGDRRFPRHGHIEVIVRPALTPSQPGWPGAVELRDAARNALLAVLGEADLDR